MIYLGSDHAGFKLKGELKKYLDKKKIKYEDLGADEYIGDDDYPDYAKKVSKTVVKNKSKGILICGTGQGICIAANKTKGVIAALSWNLKTARHAKEHLNANILCLPGFLSKDEMRKVVDVWIKSKVDKSPRHKRRIRKILK